MTGKQRMLKALRFEKTDRPPHFETMFQLETEAFGLEFPPIESWEGMSRKEKDRAVGLCTEIYGRIIERYEWDALGVYFPWSDPDGVVAARKAFGDRILIGSYVGGGIWSIDTVEDWETFAVDLAFAPEKIHTAAETKCQTALDKIDLLVDAGSEFILLPNDVAFNAGPFISPTQFAEFIAPYWARQVQRIKDHNVWAFVHTDGQIMPILDQILGLGAHLLQSIDPMAGVDIAEVKRLTYGKLALMGNVQCNLLQDGPTEAIRRSALYCLEHASPGGGYVFSTSNTIFPGMPLANYHYMLDVFHDFAARRSRSPDQGP